MPHAGRLQAVIEASTEAGAIAEDFREQRQDEDLGSDFSRELPTVAVGVFNV